MNEKNETVGKNAVITGLALGSVLGSLVTVLLFQCVKRSRHDEAVLIQPKPEVQEVAPQPIWYPV